MSRGDLIAVLTMVGGLSLMLLLAIWLDLWLSGWFRQNRQDDNED